MVYVISCIEFLRIFREETSGNDAKCLLFSQTRLTPCHLLYNLLLLITYLI